MGFWGEVRCWAIVAFVLLACHSAVVAKDQSPPIKVNKQDVAFTSGELRLAGTLVPFAVIVAARGGGGRRSPGIPLHCPDTDGHMAPTS